MKPRQTKMLTKVLRGLILTDGEIHKLHKEVDKKILTQTLRKLVGGSSGDEEKHALNSPLPS